jgi:hypothetical protein
MLTAIIISFAAGVFITLLILCVIHQRNLPTCTCGESPNKMCNICSVHGEGGIYKLTEKEMKTLHRKYKWKKKNARI